MQKRRPKDFRVIIASATLDAEKFRDFFETNRRAVYPGADIRILWSACTGTRVAMSGIRLAFGSHGLSERLSLTHM